MHSVFGLILVATVALAMPTAAPFNPQAYTDYNGLNLDALRMPRAYGNSNYNMNYNNMNMNMYDQQQQETHQAYQNGQCQMQGKYLYDGSNIRTLTTSEQGQLQNYQNQMMNGNRNARLPCFCRQVSCSSY
ncbi:unnamed protein product, partial [Mesorhabditis spiculigera]